MASGQISKPMIFALGLGAAGIAVFATWWFFLRDAGLPEDVAVRRPETIDTGALRDARFSELRAPAVPQESVRKGRANPFSPSTAGDALPVPEEEAPSGPELPEQP